MVRAGIAVAVMVGPTVAAATVLLNDPDHTGTAVPILLALLILDRARRRWWVPVLIAAVLGWAMVGDSLVLLIGVAPLVIVCGARAFGQLWVRREPLADAWYDLALAGAGVAAFVGGTVLGKLIKAAGGFVMTPSATKSIVPYTDLSANLSATLNNYLGLFSANFFGAGLNDWLAVTAVHLVFACLVAGALFLALRGFGRDFLQGDLIAQLLAVAIVINILAYVFLYPGSGGTIREVAPIFGLGGALAGRVLAEPLLRRRLEPLLAIGALAALVMAIPPLVVAKAEPPAAAGLARFLADHGLKTGLASYWNADSATLDSRNTLVMAPVRFHPGHGLEALPWEIQTKLFDSSDSDANFVVATGPGQPSSVTPAEAIATFGQPYQQYHYHGDTIMVWQKNLLSQLGSPRRTVRSARRAEWSRHTLVSRGAGATLCRIAGSSAPGARYFLRVHESGQRQLAVTAPVGEEQTRPAGRRTATRRLAAVAAVAALTIGLFWAYLLQSRNSGANSDAAAQALQGWQLVHGHLLLGGWFLSDVSFYTFEVPLDGLISLVVGLRSDVIHIAAAAEYALLVLFAALVAAGASRDRRRGGREAWVRGLIAAGIMVAPGANPGAHVLLLAPDHTGIGVPVLITLLVVDRRRPRRLLPVLGTALLVCLLLIWAQLDDPVAEFSCALPLALACATPLAAAGVRRLVGLIRARGGRHAAPPLPWRREAELRGYDLALLVAAVVSFGLTQLANRAITSLGGFYLHAIPAKSQISHWATVPAQLRALGQNLMYLFGSNFWIKPQPLTGYAYLHLIGLALALIGLLVALWSWPRADRVTRTLVVALFAVFAAGAVSPLMQPISGAHEIAIMLPLGACLAGRVIGPWLARATSRGRRPPGGRWPGGVGEAGVGGGASRPVRVAVAEGPGGGGVRARRGRDRLPVRPWLRRCPAVTALGEPGAGRLPGRAPPDQRPRRLLGRGRYLARQRRQGDDRAAGGRAQVRLPVGVQGLVVRLEGLLGQLRHRARSGPGRRLYTGEAGDRALRQARPGVLPRQDRGHGLRPQPAEERHPADAGLSLRAAAQVAPWPDREAGLIARFPPAQPAWLR